MKNRQDGRKFLIAPVDRDFHQVVRIAAAYRGISMAELVRNATVQFLSNEKRTEVSRPDRATKRGVK